MPRHLVADPQKPDHQRVHDRRELIEWAEPVIADRVVTFYRAATANVPAADGLALEHRQLWRSALMGHKASALVSRTQLQRIGKGLGLDGDFVDAVDQDVMDELLDIVLQRYQGSRATAKRYGLVLLATASQLGALRAVA